MKVVDILYGTYYDFERKQVVIGGVQTYITMLIKIINDLGWSVRIFQQSGKPFKVTLSENVEIIGLNLKNNRKRNDELMKYVYKNRNSEDEYITLFATNNIIPSYKVEKSLSIQHGIFWDVPSEEKNNFYKEMFFKFLNAIKIIKQIQNVEKLVCVDYNFINWYRTQTSNNNVQMFAIPNFSVIPELEDKPEDIVKIIFARRLYSYRGTKIFACAAQELLEKYGDKIEITIAGTGPDQEYMREKLEKYSNAIFTKYESQDSIKVHMPQHIAVVPTLGSEGTSLSLLEAMASGCAVVCTDVGGLTNIVLNRYNGIMIRANKKELVSALSKLVEEKDLRKQLAIKARETVEQAFSYDKWEDAWKEVLLSL